MKCLVSVLKRKKSLNWMDGRTRIGRVHTMSHIAPKVLANDDVPGGPVASVKLLLDLRSDVLLDIVLFEGSRGHVDALLLQVLAHIDVLDDRLGAGAASCATDGGVSGSRGGVEFL